MNDNLRRPTSTPISDTVKRLNEEIERGNQLKEQGYTGEKIGNNAEGYVSLADRAKQGRKSWKIDRKAKIGMILASVSLTVLLVGIRMNPADVGFTFDYNTASVSISQTDPNDYTTKSYDVTTQDGAHSTLTFDELDTEVPRVAETQQMVSIDMDHAPVGVTRVEDKGIKGIISMASVVGFFGGVGLMASGIKKTDKRRK